MPRPSNMSSGTRLALLFEAFKYPGNRQEVLKLLSSFPDQSEIKNIKDDELEYSSNRYLIHFAAWNGWTDIVELLVTQYKCDPNCTDRVEFTALHDACYTNSLTTVKYLATHCCLDPLQLNKFKITPLDFSGGETRQYLLRLLGQCVCYVCIV